MNLFINFTNHPKIGWEQKQIIEAEKYGQIIDEPFPQIDPRSTKEEIATLAERYVNKIAEKTPVAVLCQGEFTFCYAVISGLKARRIKVVAACSRRITEETDDRKIVKFIFEGFREY